MQYITLFLSMLVLFSCGGSGGGDSKSGTEAPRSTDPLERDTPDNTDTIGSTESEASSVAFSYRRKVELLKDFSNFEVFKQSANEYIGTFTALTGNYIGAGVKCEKTFFDGVRTSHFAIFNRNGTKAEIKLPLVDDDPAIVELDCRITLNDVELEKTLITLKKSYVVKGSQNANFLGIGGAKSIEALILDEDSVLQTDGNILSINMKQLISNKGKIVTYPASTDLKARDNEPGLSGKMINISTIKAFGQISFELRGLDAGIQTKIPDARTEIPHSDDSLNGSRRARSKAEADGKRGYQGNQGHQGLPGYNGGETGFLVLRILDESDVKLNIKYFAGRGSDGGKGGLGGKGGPGGVGSIFVVGAGRDGLIYSKGNPGARGSEGDIGIDGEKGLNGKTNSSFVLIGNGEQVEVLENWKNFGISI